MVLSFAIGLAGPDDEIEAKQQSSSVRAFSLKSFYCFSCKAKNANGKFAIPINSQLLDQCVPKGRICRILPILYDTTDHECAVPKHPLYDLRICSDSKLSFAKPSLMF